MNREIYLFLPGEKGLYSSDDGIITFPHREWTGAKPGFAKVTEIVSGKGNYRFAKGEMIEVLPMDFTAFFDTYRMEENKRYLVGNSFGMEMLFVSDLNWELDIYVNTPEGVQLIRKDEFWDCRGRIEKNDFAFRQATRILYNNAETKILTLENLYSYFRKNTLGEEEVMAACIQLRSTTYRLQECVVYDETFIVPMKTLPLDNTGATYGEGVYVMKDKEAFRVSTGLQNPREWLEENCKNKRVVTVDEIEKECLEHRISVNHNRCFAREETDTVKIPVLAPGGQFKDIFYVIAFNGRKFSYSFLDNKEDVKKVEESFAEMAAYVKSVTKKAGRDAALDIARVSNPRAILL